jgi:copper chaperone CopZ
MQKIILKVEGMSCQHCVSAIKDGVGLLPGVEEVTVNLQKKKQRCPMMSKRYLLSKL